MANRQQRGNREAKKPKKEKIKVIAAAPPKGLSMAADLGFRQKEIASRHLTHRRKMRFGRLRTMPCGLYTMAVAAG